MTIPTHHHQVIHVKKGKTMSKYRKPTNKKTDGKKFSKTAEYSHPKNNQSNTILRGGIRT